MPVVTAFAPKRGAVCAKPQATRVAIRPRTRFVNPGSTLGSKITPGIPCSRASSIMGPEAYPPTPKAAANRWRCKIFSESHIPAGSVARLRSNFIPPMPFKPATRIVSSGNPACGTSFASIPRSVPTNTTCLAPPAEVPALPSPPRSSHALATASAGKTCPPVPPPAINKVNASAAAPDFSAGFTSRPHAG